MRSVLNLIVDQQQVRKGEDQPGGYEVIPGACAVYAFRKSRGKKGKQEREESEEGYAVVDPHSAVPFRAAFICQSINTRQHTR